MATMIPNLSEEQFSEINSHGEVSVYKALRDKLSEKFTVFFQVAWIIKNENQNAKDGETDFIICHPDYGYICLEVKGGGVSFDSVKNQWFSIDRYQHKNEIKDPINQALRAKYSIRAKLYENNKWKSQKLSRVLCGHAVFFPDIGDATQMSRIDMPINLIGTSENLSTIDKWVKTCFEWWKGKSEDTTPLGKNGIEIIRDIFSRSFYVNPLVSSMLIEEEEKRLKLTNEQMKILDLLRKQRRVAVSGGAGTGKTVLAVEKAKRLACEGFNTLLTCYNRPLADHLSKICEGIDNLSVMNFHQLCDKGIKEAGKISGRDLLYEAKVTFPDKDEYDVQRPNALAYAVDIITERFDAIVCDEGQDFREEFWFPLELLLADYEASPFYIFYDDNQNLYSRVSSFPISNSTFPLSMNCRNTVQIHNEAYKYYKGEPVNPSDLLGQETWFLPANSLSKQAQKVNSTVVNLIVKEKVNPNSISILIADAKQKNDYFNELEKLALPRNVEYVYNFLGDNNQLLLTTVNRFKGLESEIVILWGIDNIDINQNEEQLYVGMSRAKSILYVVGNYLVCSKLQSSES